MHRSPILVTKSRRKKRATVGRSPIHGNKPITMARVDSVGRDNPLKVGVKPYMQNAENIDYEMSRPPENRLNIGTDERHDPEKHGPLSVIPDRETLKRKLLAGDQSVHPSRRLGYKPRYLVEDHVVTPRFGSFWSAPTLRDLSRIHPTAHDEQVRLIGTALHPREVADKFRGPWQHHEEATEAFAESEIKPEDLLDLTPVFTTERGYSPYWYNHPEEKDPEHAYAEERKFAHKEGIDFATLMDLFNHANDPKPSSYAALDFEDPREYEKMRKPIEQAMAFLREKFHPSEGHAMMQDLLMQDDIPKTPSILRRLSTDIPSKGFINHHGSFTSELLRNPRYQKRIKDRLKSEKGSLGYDYRELRRLYEEKGENPDSPENTTHILDHLKHRLYHPLQGGKRDSISAEVRPEAGDLATLEDWKAHENLPKRKWSIPAGPVLNLVEGHNEFPMLTQSEKSNLWSNEENDDWNQLKFNIGTLAAPNVRREMPYHWWSASERADPSWMGIQYDDYTDLARKVGGGLYWTDLARKVGEGL